MIFWVTFLFGHSPSIQTNKQTPSSGLFLFFTIFPYFFSHLSFFGLVYPPNKQTNTFVSFVPIFRDFSAFYFKSFLFGICFMFPSKHRMCIKHMRTWAITCFYIFLYFLLIFGHFFAFSTSFVIKHVLWWKHMVPHSPKTYVYMPNILPNICGKHMNHPATTIRQHRPAIRQHRPAISKRGCWANEGLPFA